MAAKTDVAELNAVLATLEAGKTAEPTTIRDFISWFGAQRRTRLNVEYIEAQLAKAGVRTVPGYLNRWVDSPLTFELASKATDPNNSSTGTATSTGAAAKSGDEELSAEEDDPSFRIGNIKSATSGLTAVKPNASLQEAVTLMMARNYSQLPVMQGDRTCAESSVGRR